MFAPQDVGVALDHEGIAVRAGTTAHSRFCGVKDTVRPSLALYDTTRASMHWWLHCCGYGGSGTSQVREPSLPADHVSSIKVGNFLNSLLFGNYPP